MQRLHTMANIDTVLIRQLVILVLILFSCINIISKGVQAKEDDHKVTNIGAVIDVTSRTGKEEITAMEIAVQSFNNKLNNHGLSLYVQSHGKDPMLAAAAAEKLIKENNVTVIIGLETWELAAPVAEIGTRARVPVLSFTAPSITLPLSALRWPFLAQMANNDSEQMTCIAAIIRSYGWKKVIAIYEDEIYGGDSGKLAVLIEALQDIGSEIEHTLVLPPISSLSNTKEVMQEELMKLLSLESRVFVVLKASSVMTIHLFEEAKNMGFMGRDSAWIITDKITTYLDSFNTSIISSMAGVLGIKTYYTENSSEYETLYGQFKQVFRKKYEDEDNFEPGIYALKAYDAIQIITEAMEGMINTNISSKQLSEKILSSNFTGLSGEIQFERGMLSQNPTLRIVNVVGKKYKELDFWLPSFGFSRSLVNEETEHDGNTAQGLYGQVTWPADLNQVRNPKGWAMPTNARPLIIGVPGRTSFEKFVKVKNESNQNEEPEGYCIDLFKMAREVLGYDLPYKFVPHFSTYDDLVRCVHNKTFDAVVGDITILANRAELVEFTQPYAESGLSLIVPAKSEESAWMFMKPFTWEMWMATGAMLIYTMFIVWFLEHRSNPEFEGTWKTQIGTAMWFTCCSLFSAHRENVRNNLTRIVVIVWLFVSLVLTSSYTASLSSMLTVNKLKVHVTDIEFLKRNNLKVGCDRDSFVRNYLVDVLQFKSENIKTINSQDSYIGEFEKKHIAAAFLELPYEKVFINNYCKKFSATTPTYRFGGLGFMFHKGSPIAMDFSKAILTLSENGALKDLEEKWFAPSPECSTGVTDNRTERLRLHSFWGLYIISGATSTICFFLFIIKIIKDQYRSNTSPRNNSIWSKAIRLARFIYQGQQINFAIEQTRPQLPEIVGRGSSRWKYSSPDAAENHEAASSEAADVEMLYIPETDNKVTNIGAIIDVDSRIGKEEKTALEIAVQSFNNNVSNNRKLSLYIQNSRRDPLLAATAAEKLIEEQEVKAIIGLETWEEAALVADRGSRARVPVLSFAAPAIITPSRWPFLVTMANGDSEQMKCIAATISSFNWKRVVVIYEDDTFGGDSGKLALLSEALRDVGSEIEYRLVLPPLSSVSNPNKVVQDELIKLFNVQTRVYIVLQESLPMTIHLFEKAKDIGLIGRDSAWIITDTISSYFDSFNSSVISSMQGILGIKTYYDEGTNLYKTFYP
ncbi:hypothetical protein Gotur_019375, partial [Gossypium turneri]